MEHQCIIINNLRKVLLLFLILIPFSSFGITNGVFVESSDGWRMSIEGNNLYIFAPEHYVNKSWPDTIAICRLSEVSANIIQVSTLHPTDSIYNSFHIVKEIDSTLVDSVRIRINLPEQQKFQVTLGVEDWGIGSDLQLIKMKTSTVILSRIAYHEWFNLLIKPNYPFGFHRLGEEFLLYPQDLHKFIEIEIGAGLEDYNSYTINIPALTEDYFYQFQIQGEYMIVSSDTIKWRNMEFVRVKQPFRKPRYPLQPTPQQLRMNPGPYYPF